MKSLDGRYHPADMMAWSASEMTYIVSSGALNSTHSLTHSQGMNLWRM